MKKSAVITIIFIFYLSSLLGQCTYQITHSTGTKSVNGVLVTVTSDGIFDLDSTYCITTSPYFIGYNYDSQVSDLGSYSFSFSPSVSMVTLNFSGISNLAGNEEEVQIFVNGTHYSIPSAGILNGCDAMAVLTSEGNIAACNECSVSGWMGTSISGPISSLTVLDTVIAGEPRGAIFSLFICDSISNGINDHKTTDNYHFSSNPFANQTILKFPPVHKNATFTLFNLNGQLVKKVDNITGGQVIINRDGIPSGIYSFMLRTDNRLIATGKLIAE